MIEVDFVLVSGRRKRVWLFRKTGLCRPRRASRVSMDVAHDALCFPCEYQLLQHPPLEISDLFGL